MLPDIPTLSHYDISPTTGFLPSSPPLEILLDPYYSEWEALVQNLQPLLHSNRLRALIHDLPVITTTRLRTPAQYRRAYVLLSFLTHAYIWGASPPASRIPPSISIPFKQVCTHMELPTVATYAGVVLWNWKPIFPNEKMDTLSNLATLHTFTGSMDESWFYLVSAAIEARGGPLIPLMLRAIQAARDEDAGEVVGALHVFAERLEELGGILQRMYEHCDPHIFYHRIRPFLAGSKNMAHAGLPNGVVFDTGTGDDEYVQYGGGSNAQSSLIQFFDIVLGVEHRPTGTKAPAPPSPPFTPSPSPSSSFTGASGGTQAPPNHNNFIHEMRSYMPGPHRRFLDHLTSVANIRSFVESNRQDKSLTVAYDAALAMLRAMRDTHMRMVSRYIVVKSHESSRSSSPARAPAPAPAPTPAPMPTPAAAQGVVVPIKKETNKNNLIGTGGTALISFLKQARDETGEAAVGEWFRRTMRNAPSRPLALTARRTHSTFGTQFDGAGDGEGGRRDEEWGKRKLEHEGDGKEERGREREGREKRIVGLSGVWRVGGDEGVEGGICHW